MGHFEVSIDAYKSGETGQFEILLIVALSEAQNFTFALLSKHFLKLHTTTATTTTSSSTITIITAVTSTTTTTVPLTVYLYVASLQLLFTMHRFCA